jgi:TldD protein
MRNILRELVSAMPGVIQLRYHRRKSLRIKVENGMVKEVGSRVLAGVGARILVDGVWGFSSTADVTKDGIYRAIKDAHSAASIGKGLRETGDLATNPATGDFAVVENRPLAGVPAEEKIALARTVEEAARKCGDAITNTETFYSEYLDDKIIVTSNGADVAVHDPKAMFYVTVLAADGELLETGMVSCGSTGGWDELFRHYSPEEMPDQAAGIAMNNLKADVPEGGMYTAILDPSVVGLLSHEAIGHTVEADFVLAGAITKDKIGEKVASEKITLVDDPLPSFDQGGAGVLPVDDEGNKPCKATIIENGILKSYLHDAESANVFGVANTGNARAFTYKDEPLIRMRNTYIEPGENTFDEMLAATDDGVYLKRAGGGQADSNAEFMFMVGEAWKIEKGKITRPLRGVAISGQAFEVLSSADMVGNDVLLDMGSGHCGKIQPARVDGGGPHLRCTVKLGGKL